MKIEVLGTGCPKCKTLEKQVYEIVKEMNIDAEISKIEDIMEIMTYNVLSTPGLVIEGKLVSSGRIPSKKELTEILTKNIKS